MQQAVEIIPAIGRGRDAAGTRRGRAWGHSKSIDVIASPSLRPDGHGNGRGT
jgi:hypothetical protein